MSSSPERTLPNRWQRFRSQPYLFWPSLFLLGLTILILLFFAAIQFGADFGTFQDQLSMLGLARPFQPQQEGEILIVITNFQTDDGTGQSPVPEALKGAIEEQAANLDSGLNVRIEIDPKTIAADDIAQAREIGQFHRATTIIWGIDTGDRIETNFLDITRPDFESFTAIRLPSEKEQAIHAAPDEYVQFMTNDLLAQIDFLALYTIGNAYLNSEEYVQAETIFGNALDTFEDQSGTETQTSLCNLWFRMAYASGRSDRFEQAIDYYTQIIDSDPEHVDALTNRGNAYFSLEEYDSAIADYDQAMTINPQSLITLANRGNTFVSMGEYDQALADFDRATEIDSQLSVIYALRGSLYAILGDYEKAVAEYDKALALDPQDSWTLNNRAGAFAALGEYSKAITDLNEAIALDPQFGIAYYSRGNLYARLGESQKAIADFSQVITLDPQFALAYYNRATVYDSLGEYEKAIADYDQAIVMEPDNKEFYSDRGVAYGNIGDHERAIADFDQVISLDPQQDIAYFNRGNAYAFLGEHEKALADYNQALALDPTFGSALYRRALAFRELGRFDDALADLRSALALDPPPDVRTLIEQIIAEIEIQAAN